MFRNARNKLLPALQRSSSVAYASGEQKTRRMKHRARNVSKEKHGKKTQEERGDIAARKKQCPARFFAFACAFSPLLCCMSGVIERVRTSWRMLTTSSHAWRLFGRLIVSTPASLLSLRHGASFRAPIGRHAAASCPGRRRRSECSGCTA